MRFGYRLGLATVVCVLSGTLALATPISGSVNISSGLGNVVAVGFIDINFSGLLSSPANSSAQYDIASIPAIGNIGTVLVGSTGGTIQDLHAPTEPVNMLFGPMTNFIVFNGTNALRLELEFIYPGTNPIGDCTLGGPSCTPRLGAGAPPPWSPFNLDNNPSSGLGKAEFSVRGYAYNDNDGDTTADALFKGIFTAQFPGTYQVAMQKVVDTGWESTSWSGTLVFYAVPEPSTLSFLGIGLALVGAGGFVRRRRRSL